MATVHDAMPQVGVPGTALELWRPDAGVAPTSPGMPPVAEVVPVSPAVVLPGPEGTAVATPEISQTARATVMDALSRVPEPPLRRYESGRWVEMSVREAKAYLSKPGNERSGKIAQIDQEYRRLDGMVRALPGLDQPYTPSSGEFEKLLELNGKLRYDGEQAFIEVAQARDSTGATRVVKLPVSSDIADRIQVFASPDRYGLPASEAAALRVIHTTVVTGRNGEGAPLTESDKENMWRMLRGLINEEAATGLRLGDVPEVRRVYKEFIDGRENDAIWDLYHQFNTGGVLARRLELHRWAVSSTATESEKSTEIYQRAEDFGRAQTAARGAGVHSEAHEQMLHASDSFTEALRDLVKTDEGLSRLPELIERRRSAANGANVTLSEEDHAYLAQGINRIAGYFDAVTAGEMLDLRNPGALDKTLLWASRSWLGRLARAGLTVTGTGFLNKLMDRRVADTGEHALPDILGQRRRERKALQSLRDGKAAPLGTLYEDSQSVKSFSWEDLIHTRRERMSDEMKGRTTRLRRAMTRGGLWGIVLGVVGYVHTNPEITNVSIDDRHASAASMIVNNTFDSVINNLSEAGSAAIYAEGIGMAALVALGAGLKIGSVVGPEIRSARIASRLDRFLAERGGYRRPSRRFGRRGDQSDPLDPRAPEVYLRREAQERGAVGMDLNTFLGFVRTNADSLHRLRTSLSSEEANDRHKGMPRYERSILALAYRAGLINRNVGEQQARTELAGILTSVNKVLDSEHARKLELAAAQKAERRRAKQEQRRQDAIKYYEDRETARASRRGVARAGV